MRKIWIQNSSNYSRTKTLEDFLIISKLKNLKPNLRIEEMKIYFKIRIYRYKGERIMLLWSSLLHLRTLKNTMKHLVSS
jgi:hypothetical protein